MIIFLGVYGSIYGSMFSPGKAAYAQLSMHAIVTGMGFVLMVRRTLISGLRYGITESNYWVILRSGVLKRLRLRMLRMRGGQMRQRSWKSLSWVKMPNLRKRLNI